MGGRTLLEPLQVDMDRLRADLEELATIGRREDHGVYRMAFTPEDLEARAWLRERIEAAGLAFEQDPAANMIGRLGDARDQPVVMTGSHIDTVPGAGYLDGALGVICGLEALRTIDAAGLKLTRPLEVVSFTDEEGRFGGMFGSQAMRGVLTPESILAAADLDGVRLADAMSDVGLRALDALQAARPAEAIHAFVELHIEQGPVLDRLGYPIGVVDGITGLERWDARFIGMANHAGTTPMGMRQDAFTGLAELSNETERVLEEHGSENSVATVGRVELTPGAANVVPGEARFSLEMRDTDATILRDLALAFRRTASAIGRRRDLMFEFEVTSALEPVTSDAGVLSTIEDCARDLDYETQRMRSGAAHDTQQIAEIAPAAMIFVPSKDGRSHSPAEWTAWADIEAGANVLVNTIARLAQ
jgi:N-carbamoyl-L-amino-acid hydrolase